MGRQKGFRKFNGHTLSLYQTHRGRNAKAKAFDDRRFYGKAHMARVVRKTPFWYQVWTSHWVRNAFGREG